MATCLPARQVDTAAYSTTETTLSSEVPLSTSQLTTETGILGSTTTSASDEETTQTSSEVLTTDTAMQSIEVSSPVGVEKIPYNLFLGLFLETRRYCRSRWCLTVQRLELRMRVRKSCDLLTLNLIDRNHIDDRG